MIGLASKNVTKYIFFSAPCTKLFNFWLFLFLRPTKFLQNKKLKFSVCEIFEKWITQKHKIKYSSFVIDLFFFFLFYQLTSILIIKIVLTDFEENFVTKLKRRPSNIWKFLIVDHIWRIEALMFAYFPKCIRLIYLKRVREWNK